MSYEKPKNPDKFSTRDKVLMSVVLAGGIAAGAPPAIEKYNMSHHEYISDGALDLGEELNKKFSTKLQVKSENGQFILHIGQIHGVDQKMSKEYEQKVVEHQKSLQELVRVLKEKYGITTFFKEGEYVDYPTDTDDVTVDSLYKVYQKFGHTEYIQSLLTPYIHKVEKKLASFTDADFTSQDELGLTSPQIRRKGYVEDYRNLVTIEQLLAHVIATEALSETEKDQCRELLQKVADIRQRANELPGFTDLPYLVDGAVGVLAEKGEVEALPVETLGAIENPPKTRFNTFGVGADFHERRENVSTLIAYEFALNNPDKKYVPIVYGKAHDFTNNIEAVNNAQTDAKYKIGLIRIDYKN